MIYHTHTQSFSLSCFVRVRGSKQMLTLDWLGPSDGGGGGDSHMRLSEHTSSDKTSPLGYDYLEIRRNMTVDRVDLVRDAGTYTCRVQV